MLRGIALGIALVSTLAIAGFGILALGLRSCVQSDRPVFCRTGIEALDEELARAYIVATLYRFRGKEDDGFVEIPTDERIITREVRQFLPSTLIRDLTIPKVSESLEPMWVFEAHSSFGTRRITLISLQNCEQLLSFDSFRRANR